MRDGGDHRVGVGERGCHRLFHQDGNLVRSQPLNPFPMPRGRWADDQEIGLGRLDALGRIDKHRHIVQLELAPNRLETVGIAIAQTHDLGSRMFPGERQIVSHMKMFEADTGDAPRTIGHDVAPPI